MCVKHRNQSPSFVFVCLKFEIFLKTVTVTFFCLSITNLYFLILLPPTKSCLFFLRISHRFRITWKPETHADTIELVKKSLRLRHSDKKIFPIYSFLCSSTAEPCDGLLGPFSTIFIASSPVLAAPVSAILTPPCHPRPRPRRVVLLRRVYWASVAVLVGLSWCGRRGLAGRRWSPSG